MCSLLEYVPLLECVDATRVEGLVFSVEVLMLPGWASLKGYALTPLFQCEEEDTCMPYEEEDAYMSYALTPLFQ
jgi:hypothetical protein